MPHNLPVPAASFVGRRPEIAAVRRLLTVGRSVTLVGPCGVGKTRLALQVAGGVLEDHRDGVWWIDLDNLPAGRDVHEHIAAELAACGVDPQYGRTLIVLDTCEEAADRCAEAAVTLLTRHPALRLLCTSVFPLGTPGEQLYPVGPMRLPENTESGEWTLTDAPDAIRLFVHRAGAVIPGFTLSTRNMHSVGRLCHGLDGIPLGIELAAARLRALSAEQLLERLPDRHRLLTGGRRLAVPRHRSLRAATERMFSLCTPWEQLTWTRLAVFVDGFDLAAAEAVCAPGDAPGEDGVTGTSPPDAESAGDVVAAIVTLVDMSVLERSGDGHEVRYRMLETMRLYGQERLDTSAESLAVRRRHRDWYVGVAERSEGGWLDTDYLCRERRAHADSANLRAALEFSLADLGDLTSTVRLVGVLTNHRRVCADLPDGRRWMERFLEVATEPTVERARVAIAACWVSLLQGDQLGAGRLLSEARRITSTLGADRLSAQVVQFAGLTEVFRGDCEAGAELLAEAVTALRQAGDTQFANLAFGQLVMARAFTGSPLAVAGIEHCMTYTDPELTPLPYGYVLWYRAVYRWRTGQFAGAAEDVRTTLRMEAVLGDRLLMVFCLETLAWIEAARDAFATAARLLSAADVRRRAVGMDLSGVRHFFVPHTECVQRITSGIGAQALHAEFCHGAGLDLDELLAPADPAPDRAEEEILTPRQREVVALIERGLSNREIAAELVIALRTAEAHVEHVMAKLGFTRRSQIAAWSSARRR